MNIFIYSLQEGSFGTVQASGLVSVGRAEGDPDQLYLWAEVTCLLTHSSETALYMEPLQLINVQAYREHEKTMPVN